MSRFSRRHRAYAVLVAASAVGVVTLLTTFGANAGAARHGQDSQGRLDLVSSRSLKAVDLLPGDVRAFQRFAASGASLHDVTLFGTRGDRTYYRIENSAGPACYAVGDSRPVAAGREPAHRLGQILCVPDFPSASRPLLDFTVIHGGRSDVTQDRVWRSEGIAADGVHEVAFRTPDGRTVGATPVVQNIYSVASVPSERVTDLIAKDAKGSVIAKLPTSR